MTLYVIKTSSLVDILRKIKFPFPRKLHRSKYRIRFLTTIRDPRFFSRLFRNPPPPSLKEHRYSIFPHREKDNYRERNKFLVRSNNVGALGVGGLEVGSARRRQPETIRRVQWVVTLRASSPRERWVAGLAGSQRLLYFSLTFPRKENGDREGKYTPGQIYRRLRRKSRRVTEYPTYNSCNRDRITSPPSVMLRPPPRGDFRRCRIAFFTDSLFPLVSRFNRKVDFSSI